MLSLFFLLIAHYSTKFGRMFFTNCKDKNTTENQKLPHLSIHLIGFSPLLYLLATPNTHGGPLNKARSFRRFEPKLKVPTPKALKRQNSKGAWGLCLGVFGRLLIYTPPLKRTDNILHLKIGLFAPQRKRLYSKKSISRGYVSFQGRVLVLKQCYCGKGPKLFADF